MSASSGDTYARLLAVFDNHAEGPAAAPPKDAANLGAPAERPADSGDLESLFKLIDVPPPAPQNRIMFPIKAGVHTRTNPLRLKVTSPTDGVGGEKPEHVIKMWPTTEFGKKKRHVAFAVAGKSKSTCSKEPCSWKLIGCSGEATLSETFDPQRQRRHLGLGIGACVTHIYSHTRRSVRAPATASYLHTATCAAISYVELGHRRHTSGTVKLSANGHNGHFYTLKVRSSNWCLPIRQRSARRSFR